MYAQNSNPLNQKIIIITTDGFRWQELFNGADSTLLFNEKYVNDTAALSSMYWANTTEERRKLLMPFAWNYISKNGQLWGNRKYENKVSVKNLYHLSYAGYNEILTGYADKKIIRNRKRINKNQSLLSFLGAMPTYKNNVAMFGSWDIFKYIYNNKNETIYLNTGYEQTTNTSLSAMEELVNAFQNSCSNNKMATRSDMLTYSLATDYMITHHPSILHIAFGETDEYAHQGKYDKYLQQAHLFDNLLQQLWTLIQRDEFYKDCTTVFITTDHGRGENNWTEHGPFISSSKQTWLMQLGNNTAPLGEMKNKTDIKANQFAQTIASYLNKKFQANHPVSNASLKLSEFYITNNKWQLVTFKN
jgi:hypothetical protein